MGELTIYSPCYYPSTIRASGLMRSARRRGIEVVFYGVGEQWHRGVRCKFGGLRKAMEKCATRYAMCLDSNDTFLQCGEEEILAAYRSIVPQDGGLLVGAEQVCWPLYKLQRHYDYLAKKKDMLWSGFRYPNSGNTLGSSEKLYEMASGLVEHVEEVLSYIDNNYLRRYRRNCELRQNSDQAHLMWAVKAGEAKVVIDRKLEVFMSSVHIPLKHLRIDSSVTYLPFGVKPCIVHASGKSRQCLQKRKALFAALFREDPQPKPKPQRTRKPMQPRAAKRIVRPRGPAKSPSASHSAKKQGEPLTSFDVMETDVTYFKSGGRKLSTSAMRERLQSLGRWE